MPDYRAPITDMRFVLNHVVDLAHILSLEVYADIDDSLVSAILEESAKFTAEVLAPLNKVGDQVSSTCIEGEVSTPPGWKNAYQQFIDGGWNGLAFSSQIGGQGLPWSVATPVQEMWHSANMSFGLCPLLTQGAVRALESHGSPEQCEKYMQKLVSGQWSGTMNLTESHAGSDLAAIRTKAEPHGDCYRIAGQKIFITYGEHDLTENIIHFVLARCTDSPAGVKGISLFIVPKFLVNPDGSLGERNDLRCVSLEHKLGIRASPTAVMSYGDNGGAIGYLVGEKNRGLEYMFTMMNLARHAVGVEGLAVGERAYQQALDYARGRVQGSMPGSREKVAIMHHPDVRRMLMTMKSLNESMRCLAYYASSVFDLSNSHPDARIRENAQKDLGLLIPLVKGWCAEIGNEVTYIGVQVHGGMGFIEETGAAQHMRDARITPIYEGTTGIQANDLISRKILKDDDKAIYFMVEKIAESLRCECSGTALSAGIVKAAKKSLRQLKSATDWIYETGGEDPNITAASVAYMHLFSLTVAGWLMALSAARAVRLFDSDQFDRSFLEAKVATARFFAGEIMPRSRCYAETIQSCVSNVMALSDEQMQR